MTRGSCADFQLTDDFDTIWRNDKGQERGRKGRRGLQREGEQQPQKGKSGSSVANSRGSAGKPPVQTQLPPYPAPSTILWHQNMAWGRGGVRRRTGALRQPPPLREAAGTGWSRLEPAVPAREPKPHKARRRLTARVSLRRAGVGGAVRHPSPTFVPFLGPRAARASGRASARCPPRGPDGPRVLGAERSLAGRSRSGRDPLTGRLAPCFSAQPP